MKTEVKRHMMMTVLALGTIWDILCLLGMFRRKWMFSLAIVSLGSLCTLIPLMLRNPFPNDEKSKYTAGPEAKEKADAVLAVCLLFAWVITLIACLVYPV